jgi:hypothetical protein
MIYIYIHIYIVAGVLVVGTRRRLQDVYVCVNNNNTIYICVYICMYVCMCVCVCVCLCVCVCVCVYIYINNIYW